MPYDTAKHIHTNTKTISAAQQTPTILVAASFVGAWVERVLLRDIEGSGVTCALLEVSLEGGLD